MSREFLKLLAALMIALLPVVILAEGEHDKTIETKYVIKKGDTLWEISSEKLKDPFLWPRLWRANPQIRNPHLIFPGTKLTIPSEPSEPSEIISGEREEIQEEAAVQRKPTRVIVPKRITQTKLPVQKRRYLVSREMLLQSGYISEGVPVAGRILLSPKMRTILGNRDEVYIATEGPLEPHTQLYIVGQPESVLHPVTGARLGLLIRIIGLLEILGDENGNEKAVIRESYEEIRPGDFLTPFYQAVAPFESEQERRPPVSGVVLKVRKEQRIGGMGDVVYLDKGSGDGIEIGDFFTITSGAIPGYPIGTATIISVKDTTSVAFVKKSVSEIKAGDFFKN